MSTLAGTFLDGVAGGVTGGLACAVVALFAYVSWLVFVDRRRRR